MFHGLRSKLTFLVVLALLAQTIPAGAVQQSGRSDEPRQQVVTPAEPKTPKAEKPKPVDPAWDPKDPAAVQYSDGAWGIVYNDNANPANLIFRRSLGGADPQYWRDPITVEAAADRPAMVKLGGTTAVFFRRTAGTVKEIFLKTSTDDGATWSAATQITSASPNDVFQIQVSDVAGTIHLFYSRSDTSGVLQYRTSGDLTSWSAAATVGQPVGPLQSQTFPYFDVKKLSSGDWAMTWLNVSIAGGGISQPPNDLGYPVVWYGSSADLASTTWANKQELAGTTSFGERFPKAVSLAQDATGAIHLAYQSGAWPSDDFIFLRSSADGGVSFAPYSIVGYEPSRSIPSSAIHALNPYPVKTSDGAVRLFWDMEAPIYAGSYPAQLFRRDLPAGPITQISVSKDQKAKCGPCVPTGAFVADPVNLTTGNFTLPESDIAIPGKGLGLSFTRTYNAQHLVDGPLGFGWSHNYDEHLQSFTRGEVLVVDGSGRNDLYTPKAGGGYDPPPGGFATLVHNPDQTFTLTETSFIKKTFTAEGKLSAISDRNINTLTLAYDPQGKLATVTDPGNRTLSFAYSGDRISSITDPLSRALSYGYSPAGELTSFTDARSKLWSFTYDAEHRMLTKKDPNNHILLTNVYTSLNRVYTQTDAKGGLTRFNYSAYGGETEVVDPRGNMTRYNYDTNYRVTKVTDPYNKIINYTYDGADNLTRIEDRRKAPINNTYFTYDSRGNVLTRKNGLNKTWTSTYNAFNEVLTETDPMGRTTTNVYDANGNLTSTTNAKSQTTTFGVGAWGQLTSVTDAREKTTNFGYDGYGNQTTVTNPYGKVWTTGFDLAGRKSSVTDPLSHESEFGYDPTDNLTSVTDARDKVTSFGYDNAGNRTSVTDPNNKTTGYGYDEKDRLTTVTDAENGVTTYSYDGNDNLLSVNDANNHTRSYTYDKNNLQLTEKDALNNTTTYVYDPAGNRTRRTDAKGQITNYGYDTINRHTSTTYPSGSVTFVYNDSDAQTSMTDSTGVTTYTLDELYRPSSITLPGNKLVGYLYDSAGNRTRITYPDAKQVNYSFDDANRMKTVTDWDSNVTTYSYDDAGRWTQTEFPTGVVETKAYNVADQLTDITAVKGQNTLTDFSYGLDNAGLRTSITTPAGIESYSYDDLYRLTGVTYPDQSTQSYSYDHVGNRLTKVEGSTTSYVYDNADRMTSAGGVTYTYDNNGNQTARGSDVFGWDTEDRMTSATVGGNSATYTYRGDDLRNSKTVGGVTTTYTWDLTSELPVVLQEGNTSYVYGLGLISQSTGTDKRYFLADGLGSTAALTDGSGAVTATYAYDVFGAIRSSTGADSTDFQFAGQQDDPTVGLQYLRARYYDLATGRFLSRDPIENRTDDPYVYARNNPVNVTDPLGLMGFWSKVGIGIAVVAGAVGLAACYASVACGVGLTASLLTVATVAPAVVTPLAGFSYPKKGLLGEPEKLVPGNPYSNHLLPALQGQIYSVDMPQGDPGTCTLVPPSSWQESALELGPAYDTWGGSSGYAAGGPPNPPYRGPLRPIGPRVGVN